MLHKLLTLGFPWMRKPDHTQQPPSCDDSVYETSSVNIAHLPIQEVALRICALLFASQLLPLVEVVSVVNGKRIIEYQYKIRSLWDFDLLARDSDFRKAWDSILAHTPPGVIRLVEIQLNSSGEWMTSIVDIKNGSRERLYTETGESELDSRLRCLLAVLEHQYVVDAT